MTPRTHILTVGLEDYFQVGTFGHLIQQRQWYRFEKRVDQNTDRALELLAEHGQKATFFTLGCLAADHKAALRRVVDAGHEVASKGFFHRSTRQMTREEFLEDARRSRLALEDACGRAVVGYRQAHEWLAPEDDWALDALAEAGYSYDSSTMPIGRRFSGEPDRRFVRRRDTQQGPFWEVPLSSVGVAGIDVPIAGGNYFRQLPFWWVRRQIRRWDAERVAPYVMYFHIWELDPEQPTISAASRLGRMRHYRNLSKMPQRLREMFARYRFAPAAEFLGIERPAVASAEVVHRPEVIRVRDTRRTPATVVVPCYNEELILPYLGNTLKSVSDRLGGEYELKFVLVDDGSSDRTWQGLNAQFGRDADKALVRHPHNKGVAEAILTGIRHAETELVASMDCDCTYDPHGLAEMFPKLGDGVDLVTASPYHPEGGVRNVPGWRLMLSRSASWMYRRVLRHKLFTYTSCFRIYRRSKFADMELTHPNFLGVAEMLGRLDLAGGRIVEHPAVLEVRVLGRSKMKTVRTIFGHLKLMAKLLALKWRGRPAETPSPAAEDAPHERPEPPHARNERSFAAH